VQLFVKLGDQELPFSPEFRMFVTTSRLNPHFLPELQVKVSLVNFIVSILSLQDQILSVVVRFEKAELEDKRAQLLLQISEDQKALVDLEDKTLKQIEEVKGRILVNQNTLIFRLKELRILLLLTLTEFKQDDDRLIETLDYAKEISQAVEERLTQQKTTIEEINSTRENYRSVAKRGSILYFSVQDMVISSMIELYRPNVPVVA